VEKLPHYSQNKKHSEIAQSQSNYLNTNVLSVSPEGTFACSGCRPRQARSSKTFLK